jgi:hypothetical protein
MIADCRLPIELLTIGVLPSISNQQSAISNSR